MHHLKTKVLAYLSAAWNYRWQAIAVSWVICLAGWAVVSAVPDQYEATAKVYIDTDTLLRPLLKDLTANSDPDQQVAVMLRTLITRPNLEQVIRLTNPHASKFSDAEMQEQVDALQSKVDLQPLGTRNLFEIGYTNNDSSYALLVTQTLLSILIDSNIGDKRHDAESARSFIDQRVAEYEAMLRKAEKERADFRAANLDIISKGTAADRVDAANTALQNATDELSTSIVKRDSLKAQLASVPQTVASGLSPNFLGGASVGSTVGLAQARQMLADLRSRYTDDFPDVIAAKRRVAELEAQGAPKGGGGSFGIPNPVFAELKKELSDAEVNVALGQHRVEVAKAALAQAKSDTAKSIEVEAKFRDLDRDYSTIEANYQALLKSRESARLAQALDSQEQTVVIRVVEPPEKPQFPAAPNRALFNSLVLIGGIAGGIAFALLLSLGSERFVTSDQVIEQFNLPLVGVVTLGQNPAEARRMHAAVTAAVASIGLLLIFYFAVLLILNTSIYSSIGA